jgi:hypothetical protein
MYKSEEVAVGHKPTLAQAAGRFQGWRRIHPRRSRLPEQLWLEAAQLARAHGVNRVARALSLGYYSLKRHVVALPPTFVEVEAVHSPVAAGGLSVVELERADGARMTVRGASQGDLVALSDSFWRCLA